MALAELIRLIQLITSTIAYSNARAHHRAMSTAILYSNGYLKHDTGHHPERRERYCAVLDGLMADEDWWQGLIKQCAINPRGLRAINAGSGTEKKLGNLCRRLAARQQ